MMIDDGDTPDPEAAAAAAAERMETEMNRRLQGLQAWLVSVSAPLPIEAGDESTATGRQQERE